MQDRRCIYFNQPHLWRSGLAYCFKTGGSTCHQIPNSPVCRAIYYSDVATALIAYEAEVEYIEDGETHRTDLKSLIERHSVANGLACHEHLPILVTRFFVPAAEKGERSGFYKYAMRTTIDFPIINFALRCGGKRPARLAAGAVAPHPVVMAETAAKIDSDAPDDEVIAQAKDELRKLAMPIKEACMTPAVKRSLYRHVAMLLDLRNKQKKNRPIGRSFFVVEIYFAARARTASTLMFGLMVSSLSTAMAAAAVPAAQLSARSRPARNDQTRDAIIASPAPVALRISALQMGSKCVSPYCAANTPSPPSDRNTRCTP